MGRCLTAHAGTTYLNLHFVPHLALRILQLQGVPAGAGHPMGLTALRQRFPIHAPAHMVTIAQQARLLAFRGNIGVQCQN